MFVLPRTTYVLVSLVFSLAFVELKLEDDLVPFNHTALSIHKGGNAVSEIMAPNNFGSALSKAALKGPLKGPLKAVIGRLQLISWTSCGVIKSKPRRRRRRRGAAAAEPLIQRRR